MTATGARKGFSREGNQELNAVPPGMPPCATKTIKLLAPVGSVQDSLAMHARREELMELSGLF